ncbi:MAG: HAMP domain-containing methyl-accepting chemotaxis protein [Rhodocyclaceae bacterium]
MSINKKIIVLVLVALLTCAALVGGALVGLQRIKLGVDELGSRTLPATMLAGDVRATYLTLHSTTYDRIAAHDPAAVEAVNAKLKTLNEKLTDEITRYGNTTTDAQEKKLLDEVKMSIGSYIGKMAQIGNLAEMGEQTMALDIMQSQVAPIHKTLSDALDSLLKSRAAQAKAQENAAKGAFTTTVTAVLGAAALGLVFIGGIGVLLGRSITGPLAQMQRAIVTTAEQLDFRNDVPVRSRDEIGRTLVAYNTLMARLRESFASIQQATERMRAVASTAESSSHQIADNSQNQSEASAGMAAAVEELTVSISAVAHQADEAAQRTESSRDIAGEGGSVVLSTVTSIQTIADTVHNAARQIEALRGDSDSISSSANIIREIAEQTNLLALNAAIEAARAGEQGRGFAVVADEVRKLAERTALSTREITELLTRMQNSAATAVQSMTNAVREVGQGVDNAQRAGESIQDIKRESERVVDVVHEISQAVREQSAASTTIAQQIEQIAQMTEQNTEAAKSSAAAVDELAAMSQDIAHTLAAYKV